MRMVIEVPEGALPLMDPRKAVVVIRLTGDLVLEGQEHEIQAELIGTVPICDFNKAFVGLPVL